jgi:TatD DNase family protein
MDYPLKAGMLDSHFHGLIMHERGITAGPLLRDLTERGFHGGIDVSTTPTDLTDRRNLYADHPNVLLSSGIHPGQCGHADTAGALELLATQLSDPIVRPAIAAIGEMGLDWYRGDEHRDEQTAVFTSQLALAVAADLPVIIHNREADDDVLALLSSEPGVRGVMHCFSSDEAFARRCLDRGFYISFAGNVTYKRSEDIRAAARYVPHDRLLLETDSPFLSPQKVRGKANHPGHVSFTYEYVARLRRVPVEELVRDVGENFGTLFPASRSST